MGERIVYFYVVDRTQRLTGVLPMRVGIQRCELETTLRDAKMTQNEHILHFHAEPIDCHASFLRSLCTSGLPIL